PRGVDRPGGDGPTCLAPGVGAPAAPGTPGAPPALDRARPGGSGRGRPLVVSASYPAGLAPVVAPPRGRDVSADGPGARGALADLGAGAGGDLAGDGDGLERPLWTPPLDPAGLLGAGGYRAWVDPDRPATWGWPSRWR